MIWSVGTKIGSGFTIILAFLLAFGFIASTSMHQLNAASEKRQTTYQTLINLNLIMSDIVDAEASDQGYLLTGNNSYLESYHTARKSLDQDLTNLRRLTQTNFEQQHRLDLLTPLINSKLNLLQEVLNIRQTKSLAAAVSLISSGQGKKIMDDIRAITKEMRDYEVSALKDYVQATATASELTSKIIKYGIVSAIIFMVIIGFIISRNIVKPLKEVAQQAEKIANGNLKVQLNSTRRQDEVGQLVQTFSLMVKKLQHLTADIAGAVNILSSSAGQISISTSQLATSAAETATAINETTTTLEEVRQTSEVTTQKTRDVAENAQKVDAISQDGRKAINETADGMKQIRTQMNSIAESMLHLSERSQSIGEIITTVDDLAQQSNLLAVNAAIEAAKAGEQGKGFSVVAQEIKNLADQSKQATNQVRTLLGDIQRATGVAVMATEQGSKTVEIGAKKSQEVGESIHILANDVSETVQAVTQIAVSSHQQLVGVEQVANAMENIKGASNQNMASAKQLETSAQSLKELGYKLKKLVEQYEM